MVGDMRGKNCRKCVRCADGFTVTLSQLLVTVVILAILVGAILLTYVVASRKVSGITARKNHELGCMLVENVWLDISGEGCFGWYVDPVSGAKVDASYMSSRYKNIRWVNSLSELKSLAEAERNSAIAVINGANLYPGNMDCEELAVATLSKDNRVYLTYYVLGTPKLSGEYSWGEVPCPPGAPEEAAVEHQGSKQPTSRQ